MQKTIDQQQQSQGSAELEKMAATELARLKRQYRIMENNRVAYAEDVKVHLRNQQHIVERLEYERSELVLAIKLAKSPINVKRDAILQDKLKGMLDKRLRYIESIKEEKQQIVEVQEQIIKLTKEVDSLKLKVHSEIQETETIKKRVKQIEILENRLEVAIKRYNVVMTENCRLREQIDSLLKERAQYNELHSKLFAQLNVGKQILGDLIDQATVSFNQRDEELNKVNALHERAARDLKNHKYEMCELQRTLDNEMKLQEFLGVKGQFRETADLNAKKDIERQAKREELQNKVESYTQILDRIKEFTGDSDIDRIIANFVKQEEENFALFNYVNELNDEVEGLQTRLAQLRKDIEEARALNTHRGQKQAETIEKLEKQLSEQTESTRKAEKDLSECNGVLEKLLVGIETLFKTANCDNSPILQLLGDNTHVTMNNVILHLGIIERKITSMFGKVYWADKTSKKEIRLNEDTKPTLKVPDLSTTAPTQPCPLCIEKGVINELAEDPIEIPISLSEAKLKLEDKTEEDLLEVLHNISGCNLPASKRIVHKRYQE